MTFVTIDLVAGAFTKDQKREMLERVTEALVAVAGEAMRSMTLVRIEEIAPGNATLGGQPLDADTLARFTARPECIAALKSGASRRRGILDMQAELSTLAGGASRSDAQALPREGEDRSINSNLRTQGGQS